MKNAIFVMDAECVVTTPIDEIIDNFMMTKDSEVIANLLYEEYKEDIYTDLNIKTKGDYISILGDTEVWSLSELENAANYTYGYFEKYVQSSSLEDILKFASVK